MLFCVFCWLIKFFFCSSLLGLQPWQMSSLRPIKGWGNMLFCLLNFGESSSCHNTFAEELLMGETLCKKLKFPVRIVTQCWWKSVMWKEMLYLFFFSAEKKKTVLVETKIFVQHILYWVIDKVHSLVELRANNCLIFPFAYISDDQDSLYRTRMAKVYLC